MFFSRIIQVTEFTTATAARATVKKGKTDSDALIATGLDALETLTTEFLLSGIGAITAERAAQVRTLADNLRGYKLRRLSTLLTRFSAVLHTLLADQDAFSLAAYTNLLADIVLTAKGVHGIRQGKLRDPKYLEELVGKTWSDKALTPRRNLELVEVFFDVTETVDGFRVFASYFIDLTSGDRLTEKLILPKHIKHGQTAKRSYAGSVLVVDEALQYPGFPPYRLKLKVVREHPLSASELERLVACASANFTQTAEQFKRANNDLFAPDDDYAFLKPVGVYASDRGLSVFDGDGVAFDLLLTADAAFEMQQALQTAAIIALFGKLRAIDGRLRFQPLSVIGPTLEY
jgi:hypothetical protein